MLDLHDRFDSRVLTLIATLAMVVLPALGGPNSECPEVPETVDLRIGEPFRFGDLSYVVRTDYIPERYAPYVPGAARGELSIDLVVALLDPATREPRAGSMVPGLTVGYRLRGTDGPVSSGSLDHRLSPDGPAYGATIPLSGEQEALELSIDISGSPRFGVDHADSPDHPGDCPTVPANIGSVVDLRSMIDGFGAGAQQGDVGTDQPTVRTTLLSSFDPRPSNSYSDVWGYDDGVVYLAIIGYTNGTLFIDVTDPASPVEVADIGGPSSSWRDIKTFSKGANSYAYIVTEGSGAGEGMQIVDVTDPLNPVLVNTYTATFTTAHNVYVDTDKGHAWAVGTDNGTRILDIATDPVNPVEIGSWTVRYVHDAYVKDNLACLSEINNGRQEVADSTVVSDLQILSGWNTPQNSAHNCWADDLWNLLATSDEATSGHVALYDVSVPTSPSGILGEYQPHPTASVHNVMFDDDDNETLSMSHYALGFKLIDTHRPSSPVEWAGYDTYPSGETGFSGAWGVYSFDPRGYHYVSDISTGLYVLRYDPTGGTLSGVVRDAGDLSPIPDARVVTLSDGAETRSAADGVYAVYAEAGDVDLRVSAWGYLTTVLGAGNLSSAGRLDADVELQRLPRVTLSGVVRRSDDQSPIAGAAVRIVGTSLVVTTQADGSYLLADVAIGQQTVTAEAFGFSSEQGRVVLDEGQAGVLDIELTPAAFVDDAEQNRGWTLGLGGDTAATGQWERVDPNGTGGGNVQPEDDSTPAPGVVAFITGQSSPGASTESNDVEQGFTTLLSPTMDATGLGAAQLRFRRWSSANAGFFSGGQLRAQVSADDGATWATLEAVANANAWTAREFNVGSFVPLTDRLRVRFRAEANTGFDNYRVLECGVDDFELVRACEAIFNAAAPDGDRDGTVDGCDVCALDSGNDGDGDGVCGETDNAPFVANPGQGDSDGDGVGDAGDNCVATANADQRDLDRDGLGDSCDADLDGDGQDDGVDIDRDDDGVADASDACPTVPDTGQQDFDLDGQGDACDPDDGLVSGVRVDADRIRWEAEQGSDSYNLYRGDLGAPALLALAGCRADSIAATFYVDGDLPAPGDGFFYLVARVAGGVEDTLGRRSDGTPRSLNASCP